MGYRAHAVSRKEEYASGAYFNWDKCALECLLENFTNDGSFTYDEGHRTEISAEGLQSVIDNVTAEDIEEAGLLKDVDDADKKVSTLKQWLGEILRDADKSDGYVEMVWY